MISQLFSKFTKGLSGVNAKKHAIEIHRFDSKISFSAFYKSAKYCYNSLIGSKLSSSEILRFPADGKTKYGNWIMPPAWDVNKAELRIIEPKDSAVTLTTYRDEPYSLAMFSASTPPEGITAEVVILEGVKKKDYNFAGIKGKIVLISTEVRDIEKLAIENGAIGVITDAMSTWNLPNRSSHDCSNGILWARFFPINPVKGKKKLFGFALSPKKGEYLRNLIKKLEKEGNGKKVKVWAKVDTKFYKGKLDFVTGLVPGLSSKKEEVIVFSHLFEPNANDNASGCGLSLEVARCLQEMIANGSLAQPRRSIRFSYSHEYYGLKAYLTTNEKKADRIVAGINLDQVGISLNEADTLLSVSEVPYSTPTFVNVLIKNILTKITLKHPCDSLRYSFKYSPWGDGFISHPPFNIPTIELIQWPYRFYHTSLDTEKEINTDALKCIGIIAATYIYFIANAEYHEACWLAAEIAAKAREKIAKAEQDVIIHVFGCRSKNRLVRLFKKTKDKVDFLTETASMALYSLRMLVEKEEIQEFDEYLAGLEEDIKGSAGEVCRRVKETILFHNKIKEINLLKHYGPTKLEKQAGKIVPEFHNLIESWYNFRTLESLPLKQKEEIEKLKRSTALNLDLPLFWIDGSRDLAEISKLLKQETGIEDLKFLIDYFQFLSKYNYVKLKHKDAG